MERREAPADRTAAGQGPAFGPGPMERENRIKEVAAMFGDIICDRMPNCVPEYYRSLWEDEHHQSELRAQREEGYQANREKIKNAIEAGLPILDFGGYGSCRGCSYADNDTMTDDEDDFDCVICMNPLCPLHREQGAEGDTE